MSKSPATPDIASGRLSADRIEDNFSDLHPRLKAHEAMVESDRCYFCYDAPCVTACPTGIDIPQFIRQISTGNVVGSASTIFNQNILGGMCARVCPTETLCEQACVRNSAESQPVKIGQLQRYATDHFLDSRKTSPFKRAKPTGKHIAVIGSGPAGLACAHALAVLGHEISIFESREKPGGLSEYGIAYYKTVNDFAAREVEFILSIGGIKIVNNMHLGENMALGELQSDFDAVFVGIGLGGTNQLGIEGEELDGVVDAVEYIAELRQSNELSKLPVGRRIIVIGGGMTAIDIAVQTKLLGADEVTICYRRGKEQMKSSEYEQNLAKTRGVQIRYWLQPRKIDGVGGSTSEIEFERTRVDSTGQIMGTGELIRFPVDTVFKAVGQRLHDSVFDVEPNLEFADGRIKVDGNRKTSLANVWAGGDCVAVGEDLTVVAVEDGKIAARSIHEFLSG